MELICAPGLLVREHDDPNKERSQRIVVVPVKDNR